MGGSALKNKDAPTPAPVMEPCEPGSVEHLAAIVIPARLASSRLPNKVLLDWTGKPLIYHTIEAALRAEKAADVGTVTPCKQIHETIVAGFKGRLLPLYSITNAANGSHRVGVWVENFDAWDTYDVIVNLQADEPCIDPRDLDNLISACVVTGEICTLVCPLSQSDRTNPDVAKAWLRGDAIRDFSRAMISGYCPMSAREHVGAYAFPRESFKRCLKGRISQRAQEYRLEQLTWLDAGQKIMAVALKHTPQPISVNTPRDYARFCEWYKQRQECST